MGLQSLIQNIFFASRDLLLLHHRIDEESREWEEGWPGWGCFSAVVPFCPPPHHHFTLIDPQSPSLPPFLHPHLAVIARLSCLFLSSSQFTSRRDCAGAPPSKTNTPTSGEVVSDSASQDLHFLPYWLPRRLPASNLAQLHKKLFRKLTPVRMMEAVR